MVAMNGAVSVTRWLVLVFTGAVVSCVSNAVTSTPHQATFPVPAGRARQPKQAALPSGDAAVAPRKALSRRGVERCVKRFVSSQSLRDPLLVMMRCLPARTAAGNCAVMAFSVKFGTVHDCPSGCFRSSAVGVALGCRKIGWIRVNDYETVRTSGLRHFALHRSDRSLFDESRWNADQRFSRRFLLPWLIGNRLAPESTRERARAWLGR